MTVLQPELVAQLASSFPDAVAWRNLADGEGLTLADWHTRSNRLAHGLQGLGVGRGDRVGLLIGNGEPLRWLVSYLGIHKAGAVAVPLLARLAPLELARILRDAGATVALCSEVVSRRSGPLSALWSAQASDADVRWDDLLSADDGDLVPVNGPDDVADIMYTSGTTGRPKGVLVRHGGLSSTDTGAVGLAGPGLPDLLALRHDQRIPPGDRPAPGGLERVVPPALQRGSLDRRRGTGSSRVGLPGAGDGGAHRRLPRFATADLSSLAVVTVGSAPLAAATLRRFGAGLPAGDVLCGYGMTEFGAVTAMPMGDAGRHAGIGGCPPARCGRPDHGPGGRTASRGEVGEVTIRGTGPARLPRTTA